MVKTDFEELEEDQVLLKVEVPSKEVTEAVKRAYRRLSTQVKVPGFRQGRVPPKVLDLHVGKGSVYEEALRELIPDSYSEAIQESGLEPISQPELDIKQIEEDKPLMYEAKVQVKPKVKLGKYKGVEIEEPPVKVSEEEVQRQVDELRERFGRLEAVSRPFKEGDFGLVNIDASVEGKQVAELSMKDFLVSATVMGLEFEKKMEGAKKGEIRDIWVDTPANHQVAKAAGKKVRYRVLVKEVKTKVLPELTDDFAQDVSEFDTIEELKKDLKKQFKKFKQEQATNELQAELLNMVSEQAEVKIPPAMIQDEAKHLYSDFERELKQLRGMTIEDYFRATESTELELKRHLSQQAVPRVKQQLVLDAIALEEKIEVTVEELDEEIELMGRREGVSLEDYRKVLERQEKIDIIKFGLVLRKAVEWLWSERKTVKPTKKQAASKPKKSPAKKKAVVAKGKGEKKTAKAAVKAKKSGGPATKKGKT